MNRSLRFAGWILAATVFSGDVLASDIPLNTMVVPINRWWLPNHGPEGDHITIDEGSSENPGGTNEGLIWYLAAGDAADRANLYRLYNPPSLDHMDSRTAGEGGYQTEGTLGFTWNDPRDGLAEVRRAHRPSDGDHMTTRQGENPPGYDLEGPLGWAFPRYGEDLSYGTGHHTALRTISNGAITMHFDRVWGGVAYELWWGGRQFLNHWDSGRELQTALFKPGLSDVGFGPTEAGDMWGHGSPLIEEQQSARSYYTRTLPLQWGPQSYGGGEHRPVVYGGEFQRRATLFNHPVYDVVRWEVGYRPAESDTYTREWVTAYVEPYVSERIFVYTQGVGFEEQAMPECTENQTVTVQRGAVVFASADLRHAIALYTPETLYASWWNFDCLGGQSATRKINLWDAEQSMSAGAWYTKTLYVVLGDLSAMMGPR
ncbi:MAG: hypothetical protein CME06_11555 [Gemmatimonadetes bacterium]|nr:hypothetical protein [Gemmatimonadota bacterium]